MNSVKLILAIVAILGNSRVHGEDAAAAEAIAQAESIAASQPVPQNFGVPGGIAGLLGAYRNLQEGNTAEAAASASAGADASSAGYPIPSYAAPIPPFQAPQIPPLPAGVPPNPPFGPGFPSSQWYIPQSFVGSASSAIGDILFPIAIVIFVIVGVWTVVQFLFSLLFSLVGLKMAKKPMFLNKGFKTKGKGKFLRDLSEVEFDDELDMITSAVYNAIENTQGCFPKLACYSGAFVHDLISQDSNGTEYDGVKSVIQKIEDAPGDPNSLLKIFAYNGKSGKSDCERLICKFD